MMAPEAFTEISRTDQSETQIRNFIQSKGSGFVYVRGRRRIGKSTLLKKIANTDPNVFYFSGALDERVKSTFVRFIDGWRIFFAQTDLPDIKLSSIHWVKIFQDILNRGRQGPVVIVFDEIQWLAKGQSGFVGLLKNEWLAWEQTKNIKVIICGSSYKFFHTQSGGEEQILRGLRTHADIWLTPIGLGSIKNSLGLTWSFEDLFFASFFLGGIPYYWKRIDPNKNFLRSLNDCLFTSQSIFLDEVDELLRIEFNSLGIKTIKKIFLAMGPLGATETLIVKKTRLSQSTINESLTKLLDYSLIFEKKINSEKTKALKQGSVFYIKDPLIISFTAVLYKLRTRIKKASSEEFLLGHSLQGKKSYYIPEFSGISFENVIQMMIEEPQFESKIHQLLGLGKSAYQVDRLELDTVQFDLMVSEVEDRVVRLIECKWTHESSLISNQIKSFENRKKIFIEKNKIDQIIESFIITNCPISSQILSLADECRVKLISVQNLI